MEYMRLHVSVKIVDVVDLLHMLLYAHSVALLCIKYIPLKYFIFIVYSDFVYKHNDIKYTVIAHAMKKKNRRKC